MSNFISDSAQKEFRGDFSEFAAFVQERDENSEWFEVPRDGLIYQPLFNEPITAGVIANDNEMNQEAVEDTMVAGSGLALKAGLGRRPVGMSAVKGVLSVGLNMHGYANLAKKDRQGLAKVLNVLSGVENGNCKIKVADEKVRAVVSSRYAIMPLASVYSKTSEFLLRDFPMATFVEGFYNHELATGVWSLEAYESTLFSSCTSLVGTGFTPMLRVSSSDTTDSAINIVPYLSVGRGIIPLNEVISVKHIGQGKIEERVVEAFKIVLAKYQGAMKDFVSLKQITVNNGYNTLMRIFQRMCGGENTQLPKKQAYEAAAAFEDICGHGPSSAYEIYISVSEAYANALAAGMSKEWELRFSAKMAGIIRYSKETWNDLDVPGTVTL